MPKSQLDWLAIAGLWLGAIIEAIKAGDLPLIAGLPLWLAAHFWSYVPAVLVTFYVIVALRHALQTPPAAGSAETLAAKLYAHVPSSGSSALAAPPSTAVKDTSSPQRAGRIYIDSKFMPDGLIKFCENKTDVHGQAAVKPYLGKWLPYRGKIKYVSIVNNGLYIRFESEHHNFIRAYSPENAAMADVLHKGDVLVIDGVIESITAATLDFKETEIVER